MIKEIKINNSTKKVVMKKEDRFLGVKGENKNETLKFTFEDNFLDGEGILEVQKPNSQKEYIILDKEEDCYLLEVKNSILSLEGEIIMQLVVRMTDNIVFKSVEFSMQVLKAIEATTEIPDEYETWDSTLAAKILEIDSKLEEVTVLEEDLNDKVENGYFKGEKGDTGEPGQDATINGVNTLAIEAGSNINLAQEGNTLTISSTGGGTSNYQDLTNKPSINNVTLSENKSLSDLGIQPAGNYLTSETDPTVPSYVKNITQENINSWNNKSDFSGDYNDLSNKPTIPAEVTENTVSGWGFTKNTGTYSKPQNGIPKTDLESAVQTSLGKADTALQTYTEQYTGTITGITMNGVNKGTSGVVDLGTVITQHQDISGKLDTSKVKNAHSTTAGDVYDVRYINSVLGDIETLLQGV